MSFLIQTKLFEVHGNVRLWKLKQRSERSHLLCERPRTDYGWPRNWKTYTLVQRAIYLIEECGVQPENLFIATFTEKAAKELITRITNELARRNITANVNEMYVGTFHSLCLRILKENLEYTRLKKNYRLLDAFDQKYTVFQNIYQFRNIPNVDAVLPDSGAWKQSEAICGYVNNLSEELVSPDDLERDVDPAISAMGTILRTYQKLLNDNNLMDFLPFK